MPGRVAACVLLIGAIIGAPIPARASEQVEALLQRAEAVRSADANAFAQTLQQLQQRKKAATAEQRERLVYLEIYADIYSGRYDVVITRARRLIRESSNPDIQLRATALLITSFALSRRFSEGLGEFDAASRLMQKRQEGEARHHVLFAMANLYNQVRQHGLGVRALDSLLDDSGVVSARNRCFAGQLRLELLQGLGKLPSDDAPILQVIDECVALREPIVSNLARMVLARQWMARGQHEEAVKLLQDHLPEVEATRYPPLISEMHSLLGEWLLAKGDAAGAERHAGTAVAGGPNAALLPLVAAHHTLYQVAVRRGDLPAALRHYRRYAEADKIYLSDTNAREMAFQIVRHQTQQKTQQIELLGQQNKVLQLQQRVQKQATQNLGLVVVLLTLLVAGIGYWAYKVKRLHLTLRRFAETDALTEISNRHHFSQQAQRSLEQCEAAGESAAVIMFDLDRFKMINDTYGHDAGDWVLRHVAATCAAMCRRIDQLGRVGGEEFAIVLHGCELNAAVRLAEDCRVRLSQTDTRDSGHTFTLTASFGVSSTATSGYVLSTLMSHADLMLYRAKREGRNRVRAYRGDVPVVSPYAPPSPTSREVEVAVFAVAEAPVSTEIEREADSEPLLERRIS